MKTLRYINLGEVEPNLLNGIWEFPRLCKVNEPTLFSMIIGKPMILVSNMYEVEKFIKKEELPSDYQIIRLYREQTNRVDGITLYEKKSVVLLSLIYPVPIEIGIGLEKGTLREMMREAEIKVLEKYGIEIVFNVEKNDVYFKIGDKLKRFLGFVCEQFGDWQVVASGITFDFNTLLARKIYRLDTDKNKLKGDIKDIGDIVGGIREVNPNIGFEIIPEIVQELADRLELELKTDTLTAEETNTLQTLSDKLNNSDWKLNAKHPEIKTE